jgi:hypothetical protein
MDVKPGKLENRMNPGKHSGNGPYEENGKHTQQVVEITNTMHKLAPLFYSYMLAPTL